jgi:hypothetical protein
VAISEDTSNQPVPVHVTATTATTASFSPQAGTLLVALIGALGPNFATTTVTVTDSLSGKWSLLKRQNTNTTGIGGSSEIWYRYLDTAPGSLTVNAVWTPNGDPGGNLVVRSLLGAATPSGAAGGTGGASVAPTATLTPIQLGSWVYGACVDWTTNPVMVANANTTIIDQFNDTTNGDTYAIFKGAASTASLVSTAYGFTNANAGFNTAAVEILPAGSGNPIPLDVSQAVKRAATW